MKNAYNPFYAECSFEKFTESSPFVVLENYRGKFSGEYYKNPYAYMNEKVESGRDFLDENMNEMGGLWSYEVYEKECENSIDTQSGNFNDATAHEVKEKTMPTSEAGELADNVTITVTNRDGDETVCNSVGEALRIFANEFECGDAYINKPDVYFLTDHEFAQEMREALANKNRELNCLLGHIVNFARDDFGGDFNFPASLEVYNQNIKIYNKLHEEELYGIDRGEK